MIIHYSLSEDDMLVYQLYLASKSKRVMKKRFINKAVLPLMYLVVALWYYYKDKPGLSVMLLFLIPLWYFLFPVWERKHYKTHYKAFIKEHFSAKIGRPSSLEFKGGTIIAKDGGTESFVLVGEIIEIIELSEIILIKLVTGEALVIPEKDIENIDDVKQHLKTLASELKIDYSLERNWQWK